MSTTSSSSSSSRRMIKRDSTASATGGESVAGSVASYGTEHDDASTSLFSQTTHHQRVKEALTGRETSQLKGSKITFLVVIFLTALGTVCVLYAISAYAEQRVYESRFRDFANVAFAVSKLKGESVASAFDSMAISITSSTQDQTWPNATIDGFEAKSQQLMQATDAVFVELAPVVTVSQRKGYEAFVQQAAPGWIAESFKYWQTPNEQVDYPDAIYDLDRPGQEPNPVTTSLRSEPYFAPVSHYAPIQETRINFNLVSFDRFRRAHQDVVDVQEKVLTEIVNPEGDPYGDRRQWPHARLVTPIFDEVVGEQQIVAFMKSEIGFESFLQDLLPEGLDPLFAVVRNTCNQELTYLIEGPDVIFLGQGDLHESKDEFSVTFNFTVVEAIDECQYTLNLHPSVEFYNRYHTNTPVINAVALAATFLLTALLFVVYDYLVESRQRKLMESATKTAVIVSSLFPQNVHDRLMESNRDGDTDSPRKHRRTLGKATLTKRGEGPLSQELSRTSRPIADLFPNVSVMFADIVGFTAWSSTREPTHVFELLESIYSTFDKVARKLDVFKVETIGDCYVAACGLPEAEDKHAVIMTRFAKICMGKMHTTVHQLAPRLGPDTSNLTMRVGIHSGPVTAGVLRGEKSRFQLFGDTVNTTARIESTGMPRRIHLSQETADLLVAAGKEHWVVARSDRVQAKGKGSLQTYWLVLGGGNTSSSSNHSGSNPMEDSSQVDLEGLAEEDLITATNVVVDDNDEVIVSSCHLRGRSVATGSSVEVTMNELEIVWNADVLKGLIRKIVAHRGPGAQTSVCGTLSPPNRRHHPLQEVKEVIDLPNNNNNNNNKSMELECCSPPMDPEQVQLSQEVEDQIEEFVRSIASMYRNDNPFHNFSHASHVVQSTLKLLSRIVVPLAEHEMDASQNNGGIPSLDPLTQFACVVAALIHDVDHCGVPNAQLVQEQARVAALYDNKSVAEQNSLDLAWELLLSEHFVDLRNCLFSTQAEFDRFRQLLVNLVLATDIMDKDLKQLRNDRWNKAFAAAAPLDDNNNKNRMATIVLEHLIQASDVAHTMQHWHVYTKWNERLFQEMYAAYQAGRADKDPSLNWYEGELGFFDFYIIPLAKKLQECKIFGVSSDEYLNYAQANRKEWETRGKEVVAKYLETYAPSSSSNHHHHHGKQKDDHDYNYIVNST